MEDGNDLVVLATAVKVRAELDRLASAVLLGGGMALPETKTLVAFVQSGRLEQAEAGLAALGRGRGGVAGRGEGQGAHLTQPAA